MITSNSAEKPTRPRRPRELSQSIASNSTISTITLLAAKIRAENAKRPAVHQHDETECVERFLECIFTASKAIDWCDVSRLGTALLASA